MDDVKWMKEAIKQAKKAESYDEVTFINLTAIADA